MHQNQFLNGLWPRGARGIRALDFQSQMLRLIEEGCRVSVERKGSKSYSVVLFTILGIDIHRDNYYESYLHPQVF